jgi:aldose 1-epimerase
MPLNVRAGSVEETRVRRQPGIRLTSGELTATFLPGVGMTGVSLCHRGAEYLALPGGLSALRRGATLGIPLLAPWANRLAEWQYTAAGVDVDLHGLPLGVDDRGLPIHGLLVGKPGWCVDRQSFSRGAARLQTSLDVDSPAFPFPHRIELSVAVTEDRLTIDTTIVPLADQPVPIAFGWHPYLRLSGAPRAEWDLRLPVRTHLELDQRGIPTGGSCREARVAAPIGERTFDDLYRLGRVRRLSIATDDTSITLHCESGYPFAQVWVPPKRSFLALEPMTSPTNALVDGSVELAQPGSEYRARFALAVGASQA